MVRWIPSILEVAGFLCVIWGLALAFPIWVPMIVSGSVLVFAGYVMDVSR